MTCAIKLCMLWGNVTKCPCGAVVASEALLTDPPLRRLGGPHANGPVSRWKPDNGEVRLRSCPSFTPGPPGKVSGIPVKSPLIPRRKGTSDELISSDSQGDKLPGSLGSFFQADCNRSSARMYVLGSGEHGQVWGHNLRACSSLLTSVCTRPGI